jgi:hypothetical protein
MSEEGSCCVPAESKQTYEGKMETKLKELGAHIDQLSDRASQEYEKLKVKREAAQTKLSQLKTNSGEAYTEFKAGMDKAFEELQKAFEEAKAGTAKATEKMKQTS